LYKSRIDASISNQKFILEMANLNVIVSIDINNLPVLHLKFMRFQGLTAASMKFRIVFWDVMPSDVSEVCAASIIRDE
jgi:hypothetical protein